MPFASSGITLGKSLLPISSEFSDEGPKYTAWSCWFLQKVIENCRWGWTVRGVCWNGNDAGFEAKSPGSAVT
ncbi:hypothetical protein V6N13_125773 [Hibiscus sabdariffa]